VSLNIKNLALRMGLAVVALPLVLWAVLSGTSGVAVFAVVLTTAGAWEWLSLTGIGRMRGLALVAAVGPLALLATWWYTNGALWTPVFLVLVISALLLAMVGDWSAHGAIRSAGSAVLGMAYVGLFGIMIPISRGVGAIDAHDGSRLLASLLAIVWLTDTLAYFGGSLLGKHKLAPSVSPNKSWEGFLFGLIGAALGGLLGHWLFSVVAVSAVGMTSLGVVVGIVGQLGDLAESMIKRDVNVKDSSSILPGHGGVLDRLDSFLFGLVVLWWWLLLRIPATGT